MHPYLTRLGVKPVVQSFFKSHILTDEYGDLYFPYGNSVENFGFAFHKVPASGSFWLAGNQQYAQVRQVMICSSAMEAISWLNNNYSSFGSLDNLLFLAAGAGVGAEHIRFINKHLQGKTYGLLFGRDVLGRVADLKLAAGIRKMPVAVYFSRDEKVQVAFRSKIYVFDQAEFSLPAFEQATKSRFKIPAYKPKGYDSFFDQLKANAGLTL